MVTAPYKPQHEYSDPYDEDEAITWTNAGMFCGNHYQHTNEPAPYLRCAPMCP